MNEFKHLMHETNLIRDENGKFIKMLNTANNKIERQEVVIMELFHYIKWMHHYLAGQDKELGILNDGPAQYGGPLMDALD